MNHKRWFFNLQPLTYDLQPPTSNLSLGLILNLSFSLNLNLIFYIPIHPFGIGMLSH